MPPLTSGNEKRPLGDWLWPRQHERWYFTNDYFSKDEDRELREEKLRHALNGASDIDETLEQVQEVAQSAVDRTAAAERRATTLSGAVAIAASLTVSGASLVLDHTKVPEQGWRLGFALGFSLATFMFVLAGLYAARAVVTFRKWAWPFPEKVIPRRGDDRGDQRLARAAELLDAFAFNWEVSEAKIRAVESSFRAFTIALLLLVLISMAFVAYQL
jgi:hypothetical protein